MTRAKASSNVVAGRAFALGRPRIAVAVAAATAATGLLACGGSTTSGTKTSAPIDVTAPASVRAQQQALHKQVIASLHHTSDAAYGEIPSYLPKTKVPTGRVVTATPEHPALAIEGVGVAVRLPHGRTDATIVGPDVPEKDQGTFQNTAKVSFDATFADTYGTVLLAASMFTITDELGTIHHPNVTVMHGGQLPTTLPHGRSITLLLRTTLPIGNGRVKYRPAGRHAVVSWDFDSETD